MPTKIRTWKSPSSTRAETFIFHRISDGPAEVYNVIIPEKGLPNATKRFGKPLRYSIRDETFHEVATLVVISRGKTKDIFLMAKELLDEKEREQLDREVEHLCGHFVHMLGASPEKCWFSQDTLKDRHSQVTSDH